MKYLFLFTIAPVKSFIAQARKTRDLKAASDILSELIKKAIQELAQEELIKQQPKDFLIFPYWDKTATSMPNKFLAKVELKDNISEKEILVLGQNTELKVRNYWRDTIGSDVIKEIDIPLSQKDKSSEFYKRFLKQLDAHLEVYWAFELLNSSFRSAYTSLTRKLAAVKNTRPFQQLPGYENGRKCSVAGDRDALVFLESESLPAYVITLEKEEYKNRSTIKAENLNLSSNAEICLVKHEGVVLDVGEGLSASVAVKRFKSKDHFPSTAEIACMSFLDSLNEEGQNAKDCLISIFGKKNWDYQLIYPENIVGDYFDKHNLAAFKDNIPIIRDKINILHRNASISNSSYYAFIAFDGDKMGKTWAGIRCKNNNQLAEFQHKLAFLLREFADKAKEFLDSGDKGRSIYAGGDDFIGFINIHKLTSVIKYLRTSFYETVHIPLKHYLEDDEELSFSAGVTIAHYKTPLGEVVRRSHDTQDIAKSSLRGGRNALAISLLKRSGESQEAYIKWGELATNIDLLQFLIEELSSERFSSTFINNLTIELYGLAGLNLDEWEDIDESLLQVEIKRLVKRSAQPEKLVQKFENKNKQIIDMQDAVWNWYQLTGIPDIDFNGSLQNFVHWLHIIDFIHRQPQKKN